MVRKNPIVLIVEDEGPMRRVLVDAFFRSNFRVFEAVDGESGLRIAGSEHPDFIILDLLMPRMDGLAMLKELRKTDWGKTVRVAVLTNFSDPARINEAAKHNVSDFWIKTDWTLKELVNKVRERIES
jgi:DNA-binding response OmpR family regulator